MKTGKIILQMITVGLIAAYTLASCKDNDSETFSIFDLTDNELEQVIDNSANTLRIPVNTTLSGNEWHIESTEKWLKVEKGTAIEEPFIIATAEENTADKSRTAQIRVSSFVRNYEITIRQFGIYDIVAEGDIQIHPTDAKANQFQPGYDIDKSIDGKFTTGEESSHYHSPHAGRTKFPVILEYFFTGEEVIDYIVYYTRQGNGNFGEVNIHTATIPNPEAKDYTLQGIYNFNMKNTPTKVSFKEGIKATAVKFVVSSGLQDLASCSEMHFFQHNTENTLEIKLLKVFNDLTCTELKEGITEQDIRAMEDNYFIDLAKTIQNNAYSEWEKDFRIQEYKAYSDPTEWATKLITKRYGNLDNLTGITVEKDEEIVVLVGDTYGQSLALQCIGEKQGGTEEEIHFSTSISANFHILKSGINKLKMEKKGQLFIIYNNDLSTNPKPIKIHIPIGSGKVSGFFDLERHKTDMKYTELISKANDKYFGVRGNKIIFYFHREKLQEVAKHKILSAIELWDDFVGWEQELMGIEDIYPNLFNNHIFAISPETGFMWASDDCIAFVYNKLGDILLKENIMAARDNAWGPAHEIGHIHQGAIDWASCHESSNNLFSNYVIYKLGKYCSRGTEISDLADSYLNKKSWVLLGKGTTETEDTEIHMRMLWQLWNYFHRLEKMPDFFPKLFKELRANPLNSKPGPAQMDFAKAVCKIANMDMTEFFDRWGFFRTVSIPQYKQYGTFEYIVNQEQINLTKEYMVTFATKAPPICYLEDRKNGEEGIGNYKVGDVGHYSQFKDNAQIAGTPTYTLSGNNITVNNGTQAVAFEIRKNNENGELLYFFNFFSYSIPTGVAIDGTTKFYAVQADGKRIEMRKE